MKRLGFGSDAGVPVYFEAAAVITALVLLGQVLELTARAATAFPEDSSDLFSGKLRLDWQLREGLGLFFGYLYEPYRLDDFAWDALQPWMQGVIKETGSSPTDIRDGVVERYLFLDSRYSDYTANVFTVGVTFKR